MEDSTAIIKSIKDLNKFLRVDTNVQRNDLLETSPKMKLNFSDVSILGEDNSSSFEYEFQRNPSFLKRHQQNVAGFDVTKRLREKDCQIVEYKTAIEVLESKLENLQSSQKRTRIQHDKEVDLFRTKQLQDKELIAELEQKLKRTLCQEQELKEEILRTKKQYESRCMMLGKKMHQLQSDSLSESDKLHKELTQLRDRVSILEGEANETSSSLHLQKHENNELEERVQALHQRLIDSEETRHELDTLRTQLSQANSKNKELLLHNESMKDQEMQFQLFESTLNQLPSLKREIQKLKEENHLHKLTRININLLEEKLSSAESQLKSFECRCNDLTQQNAMLTSARDLSEEYESVIKKEFDYDYLPPVSDFVEMLQKLKKDDENVTNSINELKASLASHKATKDEQEELAKKLKMEIERGDLALTKNAQIIKRLQRKIFLLSKERDSLKGIILSYQSESTVNPSSVELNRMNHLEIQLVDYKAEIAKLEEELSEAQQLQRYEAKAERGTDNTEEADESDKKSTLDEAEKQTSFHASQTKIIQFLDNPLERAYQERQREFNKLVKENEALKQRVKLLEEGESEDLTRKVGLKVDIGEASSELVKEFEEKAKTLEIQNQRLIDTFKKTSHELREVVYSLTGYRVDLKGENTYKLSNMYAESPDDYLLFEQASNGDLQLLETDFSSTLTGLIDSYLRKDHSYPAFLSALTINLFGRPTMLAHSSSDQEEEEEEDYEMMGEDEEDEEEDEEEDDDDDEDGMPPAKRARPDDGGEGEDDEELICLD